MWDKIAKVLMVLGAISLFPAMTLAVFSNIINTPTVLVDINTKECVAVMMADGTKGSCNQMPVKYDRQWVMLGGAK